MPTQTYPGETVIGTTSEFPNPPMVTKLVFSASQPEPDSRLQPDSAMAAPEPVPSLPMLLAKLVALGREAWRISERERAVRAEIEALREIEENKG